MSKFKEDARVETPSHEKPGAGGLASGLPKGGTIAGRSPAAAWGASAACRSSG